MDWEGNGGVVVLRDYTQDLRKLCLLRSGERNYFVKDGELS